MRYSLVERASSVDGDHFDERNVDDSFRGRKRNRGIKMEKRKLKEMENTLTWNIITAGYKKMRGGGSVRGTLNRRNAFERRWWWWFRANEK